MFKNINGLARLIVDHNAGMKIKQAGARTDLYAFSLTYQPFMIEHCGLEKFSKKGYITHSSRYPHETPWPVATVWSNKKFHTNDEAYEEFLKDCGNIGAYSIIIWELNGKKINKVFEWKNLK